MVVRTKQTVQTYLGRFPAPLIVTTNEGRGVGIGGEQWANMYLRVDLEALKSYAAGAIMSRGKQVQWAKGAIVLFADTTIAEPQTFG